jgi:hypothetical protein
VLVDGSRAKENNRASRAKGQEKKEKKEHCKGCMERMWEANDRLGNGRHCRSLEELLEAD